MSASAGHAARIIAARSIRAFADGWMSVLLPAYLIGLGFTPLEVGSLIAAALLGSAALTLAVGLISHQRSARGVLLFSCWLMLATAVGLGTFVDLWPLLLVAFFGTLNLSGSDVSIFLPTEQFLLSASGSADRRAALFARYNLAGTLAGALGALASGAPSWLAFGAYGLAALLQLGLYAQLPRESHPPATPAPAPGARPSARSALTQSRAVVLRLSALFSLDSLGGGFVAQSLLALWLLQRFELSLELTGAVFFAAGLLSAFSQLASPRLAARIGLIRTMVFTHLPANVFLVLAALMPSAGLAVLFLLLRMALSQMDVPARQAYVMAVVPPAERAAAASVTNVPRSLATALAPFLAGAMLGASSFGWPLVCGGALKIAYDLLLFAQFRGRDRRE